MKSPLKTPSCLTAGRCFLEGKAAAEYRTDKRGQEPTMIIASWNVNSIKSRLGHVTAWLKKNKPDVLMLQELKGAVFPEDEFSALGYECAYVAQKTYNGVAILSRQPMKVVSRSLKGDTEDSHARYLEVTIGDLRLINIYLPNGNPVGTEKFLYKLAWMDRLKKRLIALKKAKTPVIIGGDFNVIPEDIDCFSPKYWKNDALFQPEPRQKFREYLELEYIDAFRHFHKDPGHYTFWEYFRDQFSKNQGIRIDHFLVSPDLKKRLKGCAIDKEPRGKLKPSDHTPILLAVK
jgi:exodeoxyribonuclease-3